MVAEALCWKFYNDYGYKDLWLQYCYKDQEGNPRFTKRVTYEAIMHKADWETIEGTGMNKLDFLTKANHRSILDIELVIDIDEAKPFDNTEEKARHVMQLLRDRRVKNVKCYTTGSKGYHIHIIFKEFAKYRDYPNKIIETKKHILQWLGGDFLKASHRTGIACEGVKHWKSGEIKREVNF